MDFDHILAIGFGAPTRLEEVEPFLKGVAQGRAIPPERLKDVLRHYECIGGASPYNAAAARFCDALREQLGSRGVETPLFLGHRQWHPFVKDVLQEVSARKLSKGLAVVLAPHRSEASFNRYVESLEEARRKASPEAHYEILEPWHTHPGFIEAYTERAREIIDPLSPQERGLLHVLFTAHSIPVDMARRSRYEEEVWDTSDRVAKELGFADWGVAFHSRSGNPSEPWLEPDTLAAIRTVKADGARSVLVVPIGFLFDNAEILYDLDVELAQAARDVGLNYFRARTATDHPKLIGMFADLIAAKCGMEV